MLLHYEKPYLSRALKAGCILTKKIRLTGILHYNGGPPFYVCGKITVYCSDASD